MFGENIKRIREGKNIGVNELSRLSGVNASYISALERDEKNNPSVNTLEKLANALGVSIDDIMKSNVAKDEKLKEWDEKYNKDDALVEELKEIEDPDIRRIERARRKMDPKDKEKMMRILKVSFEDYFDDED